MTKQIRNIIFVVFAVLSVSLFVSCGNSVSSVPPRRLGTPTDVRVYRSGTNVVTVTWKDKDTDHNYTTYYKIYYNTENDTSSAKSTELLDGYQQKGTIGLASSGTYYFWVKTFNSDSDNSRTSDFSSVVSYDFTYYPNYITPSNITIAPTDRTNQVTISWLRDKYSTYTWDWLYYNTENDFSTAQVLKKIKQQYQNDYDSYTTVLPSTGIYYFWVLTSNKEDDSANTKKSELSSVASYDFTYTQLTPPENVRITTTTNGVELLKWTDNNSLMYKVYCNQTNNTGTAKLMYTATPFYASNGVVFDLYLMDLYEDYYNSYKYYLWIKSADGVTESDFSSVVEYKRN